MYDDNEPEIDNSTPTTQQLLGFVLGAATLAGVLYLTLAHGIPLFKDHIILSDVDKCYDAGYSATTDPKTNKIKCIPRYPRPNDDVVMLRKVCEQYKTLDTDNCETKTSFEGVTYKTNCKQVIREHCYEEPY